MKQRYSEFIDKLYQKGKIKETEEAFKKYPVEEEYHKGKIELLFEELKEKYDVYCISDIVFVNEYSYNNGKKGNNHMFVIIDKDNIAVPIEYFGMLISSRIEKMKYRENIFLEKDGKNNLAKDSIVKTDVVYKIRNDQILFKVGNVQMETIEEYKKNYEELLVKE